MKIDWKKVEEGYSLQKVLENTIKEKDKEIERLTKIEEEHRKLNGELREEIKGLNEIFRIGREREYHSKFLKDFQKERGKHTFPDHDEIYKRYDDYKSRVEKAIEYLGIDEDILETCKMYDVNGIEVYKILKGSDKE